MGFVKWNFRGKFVGSERIYQFWSVKSGSMCRISFIQGGYKFGDIHIAANVLFTWDASNPNVDGNIEALYTDYIEAYCTLGTKPEFQFKNTFFT